MPRSPARPARRGPAGPPATGAAPRRDYCTYFDHRYLAKGLALYRSLEEHAAPFRLFVLALTPECESALRELALESAVVVPLAGLEAANPGLLAVKASRSIVEYYFTTTAPLMRHVFERHPEVDLLTYLDADLVFFSSPEPVFAELEGRAIGIVPHRFPERLRHLERYGIYNVGWVSLRRGTEGLRCLEDWRARCLDWCFDREEDGKFADQKYLDAWPRDFGDVRAIEHPGANLAPWNLGRHALAASTGGPLVDGRPLVFFHLHRVELDASGTWEVDWTDYGVEPLALVVSAVLEPCAQRLRAAMGELARLATLRESGAYAQLAASSSVRQSSLLYLRRELRARDEELQGLREATVRLRADLAGSEADRAARLEEILRRGARIEETEARLAGSEARLLALEDALAGADGHSAELTRALERSVAKADELASALEKTRAEARGLDLARRAAESDAAAHLEAVRRLDAALREAEADRAERLALAERLGRELNAETARRAALEERATALAAELDRRARELADLAADRESLRDARRRLESALGAARERSAELLRGLEAAGADRAARVAAIEALERELTAMRGSWSWRLSRPLRFLAAPRRRS